MWVYHRGAKAFRNVDRLGSPSIREVCPFLFFGSGSGGIMKKAAVIMGSDSDLKVVKAACVTLGAFGVEYELHVYSAHRTPGKVAEFASHARENGFGVLIAAAGKAAHLAGAIAANTTLPVIGIPVKSDALDGLDALLSTVQMPPGIPVATVGIDAAQNAALLAVQMLAIEDAELADRLAAHRSSLASKAEQKDAGIVKKLVAMLNEKE